MSPERPSPIAGRQAGLVLGYRFARWLLHKPPASPLDPS